jgi:hypothetical protein
LLTLILVLLPLLALFLILRTASVCLPWQDLPSLAGLKPELFYPRLQRLRGYELASRVNFILALFSLGAFFAAVNVKKSS